MSDRQEIEYHLMRPIKGTSISDQKGTTRDFFDIADELRSPGSEWQHALDGYIRRLEQLRLLNSLPAAGYNNLACAYAWYTTNGSVYPYRKFVCSALNDAWRLQTHQERDVIQANRRLCGYLSDTPVKDRELPRPVEGGQFPHLPKSRTVSDASDNESDRSRGGGRSSGGSGRGGVA